MLSSLLSFQTNQQLTYHVNNWFNDIVKGTYARFIERTVPTGTFKALFFQDLFQRPGIPSFLMVMRAFYDGDAFVSLPGGFKWLDYLVSGCWILSLESLTDENGSLLL